MITKILFFPIKFFIYSVIALALSQMISFNGKSLNTHFGIAFHSIKKWAITQNILPEDQIAYQFSSAKKKLKETISDQDKNELSEMLKKSH